MATTDRPAVADGDVVPARDLPGPTGLANLRMVQRMFRDPAPVLRELDTAYGPVCRLGAGPLRLTIIGDPASIRQMSSLAPGNFRWHHRYSAIAMQLVVGRQSVIVSDGEDHRRRRHAVQGGFSPPRLRQWAPMIRDRVDAVAAELALAAPATGVIDMSPYLRSLILGVTVRAFFGDSFARRSEEIGELMQAPQDLLEVSALRQLPHPLPFTLRARVRRNRRALDRMIDNEIARHRRTDTDDPGDLLGVLVRSGTLCDAEIRDQVVTLIGAGYDTTSAALSWALLRVGRDHRIQDRLRVEADELLDGAVDGDAGRWDGTELPYAGRVVDECLRLHPPGLFGVRLAATDLRIGGYGIPKGTLLMWSPYLAGRDQRSWPDVERFDPDRFENPTDHQRWLARRAWVPFGRGPHMCIGFAMAQMELSIVLSGLVQRLDITTVADDMPRPVGTVVNRPAGGVVVRAARRGRPRGSGDDPPLAREPARAQTATDG